MKPMHAKLRQGITITYLIGCPAKKKGTSGELIVAGLPGEGLLALEPPEARDDFALELLQALGGSGDSISNSRFVPSCW